MGTHVLARRHATTVLDAIRRIVRDLRESSRQVEQRLGISGAQLFVLQQLAGAPALTVNELAERTLTHQSSVSVVAARLVAAGLVERRASPSDGRRVEMSLSAAGRSLLRRAPQTTQARLVEEVLRMSGRDRAALARTLGRLVDSAGLAPGPQMFFESETRRRQPVRR